MQRPNFESIEQLSEQFSKLKAREQSLKGRILQLQRREQQLKAREGKLIEMRVHLIRAIEELFIEENSVDLNQHILKKIEKVLAFIESETLTDIDTIMG